MHLDTVPSAMPESRTEYKQVTGDEANSKTDEGKVQLAGSLVFRHSLCM